MLLVYSSTYSDVFFNDTATTEIYTLSLHDALPISRRSMRLSVVVARCLRRDAPILQRRFQDPAAVELAHRGDRKSTRLNSSHANISYAVFCLKKKNNIILYT